jgi:hypothetical protein
MPRPLVTVRPINDAEASVVERALAVAATDDSASAMIGQVRSLQVVGRCECGCASIDFRSLQKEQTARVIADAVGVTPSGEPLGLILWALDNELTGLEVYSYTDAPAPLPEVTSIARYGGSNAA